MKKTITYLFHILLASGAWSGDPSVEVSARAIRGGARGKLLVGNIQNLKAAVTTDAGSQVSTFNEQLIQSTDQSGRLTLGLKSVNLIATGVPSSRGQTGLISLSLRKGSVVVSRFDNKSGQVTINFDLILNYPLIDRLRGYRQADPKDDNVDSFTELLRGQLSGRLARPLKLEPDHSSSFTGTVRLTLRQRISGSVNGGIISLSIENLAEIIQFCPFGTTARRTICVQPMFVRTGPSDSSPTGSSLPTLMENAEGIWAKYCITFDVQEPIYVDDADLKVLMTSEASELRATVDDDDCIEVFFIASWSPEDTYGGGAAWSGGTASAKIIIADNVLDVEPPSYNNPAHELGHALGLCHPVGVGSCGLAGGDYSISPPVYATLGPVMEPSGFYCDNPSDQSLFNSENASNPLLVTMTKSCCPTPEIPKPPLGTSRCLWLGRGFERVVLPPRSGPQGIQPIEPTFGRTNMEERT